MVQLPFAIPLRVEDAVVNHPELLADRVDVHARHQSYTCNHSLLIAAPLPTYHLDGRSVIVVKHSVVKDQIGIIVESKVGLHLFPQKTRGKLLPTQVAVDGIMAKALQVVGHVRQRVIDLAAQQELAVIEFAKAHAFSLPSILPPLVAA